MKYDLEPNSDRQSAFVISNCDYVFYGGARGGGKVQPYDSFVATPFGMRQMKDINVGSVILNPNGSPQKVIAVHPHKNHDFYRITFDDNTSTLCGLEHLWITKKTLAHKTKKKNTKYLCDDLFSEYEIMNTEMIIKALEDKREGTHLCIPLNAPVNFNKTYKYNMRVIHPYVIGVLLGDGCLVANKTNGAVYSGKDEEVDERIRSLGYDVSVFKDGITKKISYKNMKEELERIGIYGLKSNEKFIPDYYIYSSIESRIEIIKGLMDTDGYVDSRGHMSFTSISKRLAEDFAFIIRSLGGKAKITCGESGYKKDGEYIKCQDAYTVYFNTKMNPDLVSIIRKKERTKTDFNGGLSEIQKRIVSVKYEKNCDGQCITVSGSNALYMTDYFIVTHNSFILAYDAALHVRKVIKDVKRDKVTEIRVSIDYPEYRAVLCRKTYQALVQNLKPHCDMIYSKFGAVYNKKEAKYTFPSGAEIMLANLKDQESLDKYIGGNYHYIGIDEVNQFKWETVNMLFSSCRSTNPELRPLKRMCSNPGGVGHLWLKEKFVDKCPPKILGEKMHEESGIVYPIKKESAPFMTKILNTVESWQYIPSLVFDNKDLIKNDKTYIANLLNKPEAVQKMWIYGDFGSYTGQWLNMWDENLHVIKNENFYFGDEIPGKVCITKYTHKFFLGVDFGTAAPFACLFFAIDVNGNAICFDEICEAGMTASQQAEYVKETLWNKYRLEPGDIDFVAADPNNGWQLRDRGANNFRTDVSYYEELGFRMERGNRNRVQNAANVYEFCRIKDDGLPSLRFVECCETSIKTIPSLPPDINNPEDVDTDGDDHCFDALKYFLSIIPSIPKIMKSKTKTFLDIFRKTYDNATSIVNSKNWRSS